MKRSGFLPLRGLRQTATWLSVVFFTAGVLAQPVADTTMMNVHFLYGSKPKWKYRKTEKKEFGGLHGGHVTLQVNGYDYGFERSGGFHVFSRSKRYKSKFTTVPVDSIGEKHKNKKTVTFFIPLSAEQTRQLDTIHSSYCKKVPYDYAFFGMRCAASVREILGQLGILEKRSRFSTITNTFYPKRLRKKMFRLAKEKNYRFVVTNGSERRKWEGD